VSEAAAYFPRWSEDDRTDAAAYWHGMSTNLLRNYD